MKRRSHERFCKKDLDGRCQVCWRRLIAQTRKFGEIFREIESKMSEIAEQCGPVCGPCYDQGIDAAIALLCRELSQTMSTELVETAGNSMMNGIIRIGRVKKFPLTDKVFRDLHTTNDGKRS